MSGAIPPIPPPFGISSGNPGSPNANRVDTMPKTTDPINSTTMTNVAQSVVDKNLPQLLDSRGGSHVTNVPAFDKKDFTSWKVRFVVFLDGLKPYLLKALEDGPFVPMSSLSTSKNPLSKRQNQWSNAESRLANHDKRLKSIIMSCLPNDVMKSVIMCKTAKEMWNYLILAHEGPSDTKDTKIAALRLKFNAIKSLEGEKDSDSDVEEDQKTNNEFMADLNTKYHERALLANQKRFYKRSERVGSARKPIDKTNETCFACGKTSHFKKTAHETKHPLHPIHPQTNHSTNSNHTHYPSTKHLPITLEKSEKGKVNKGKSEKGLIAESFGWDEESVSSEDEETTWVRAFMEIAKDEPSVGKADARGSEKKLG
nr:hypothetical protein [Tanacetum cinerariifolium]